MMETEYKHFGDSALSSGPQKVYHIPTCFLWTSFLRGSVRALLLPCYWRFFTHYFFDTDPTWYACSLSLFFVIESGTKLCIRRFVDVIDVRNFSTRLSVSGLLGIGLFLTIALVAESHLALLLVAGGLTSVWIGGAEMLEFDYVSEDCRMQERPKAFRLLNLVRDMGTLVGFLAGMSLAYELEDNMFIGVFILMLICPAVSFALMNWSFTGVSLFLKSTLTRQINVSTQLRLLDLTALTEISQRDHEYSFLSDGHIASPRTGGLFLSLFIVACFQFSKSVGSVAIPQFTSDPIHDCREGCQLTCLYLMYVIGTGIGVLFLSSVRHMTRITPSSYDRSGCAVLLVCACAAWTCLDIGLPAFFSEPTFVTLTTTFSVLGAQYAMSLFYQVIGPRSDKKYIYALIASGMLGTAGGAIWSGESELTLTPQVTFLSTAVLHLFTLLLLLGMWTECLPHVEFLKDSKYFFMKELRYPGDVRKEASERVFNEELRADLERETLTTGEVGYKIKRSTHGVF